MSELPRGWVVSNLGAVGGVYCGQSSTASDVNSEGRGTPYVTGPEQWTGSAIELNKWTTTPKRVVPEGCIFITVKGAGVGKLFPGVACAIGRDVYAYEPAPGLSYPFIAKALAYTVNSVVREARGDIPGLSKEHITDHIVPLPPLAEQKRIVAKLEALNGKSARARTELARIETLVSRYKQAVLSKAFSGELTSLQRKSPVSHVEIRDVLSELTQGWSPKCEKVSAISDEQWAVITTTAIQPFSFEPNQNKVLPTDLSPRQHLVVEEGDVLITRAGPRVRCGVCCYVERTRPRLMICDKAYRLRLKNVVDPKFFVLLMNSPEIISNIEDLKTGGNDSGLNLTQERFASIAIPIWPLEEQHEIVRRIESAFAKIDRLAKEAKRALELVGKLDEAILAKAFRGELVPQDENDEPAEHLLARIRAERAAAPKAKRGRKARA